MCEPTSFVLRLSYLTCVKGRVYDKITTICPTQKISAVWLCRAVIVVDRRVGYTNFQIVEANWGINVETVQEMKYSERPVIYHAPCVKVLLDDGLEAGATWVGLAA